MHVLQGNVRLLFYYFTTLTLIADRSLFVVRCTLLFDLAFHIYDKHSNINTVSSLFLSSKLTRKAVLVLCLTDRAFFAMFGFESRKRWSLFSAVRRLSRISGRNGTIMNLSKLE